MAINPSDFVNWPRATDLNSRVSIQQTKRVRNDSGGYDTTWVEVFSCWAHVRPLNPREVEAAQAVTARLTYEVTIRYRPNVVPQMRVSFKGHDLLIHGVTNQAQFNRVLVLHCEDVTVRAGV